MSRTRSRPLRVVVFAMLASLVLVTAMPATVGAQSTALVMGSEHTTTADFAGAPTLDNVTAADGAVTLDTYGSTNVVDASGDGTAEGEEPLYGDSGGNGAIDSELRAVPSFSGDVNELTINISSTSGTAHSTVDIYAIQETPDNVADEGTLVKSNWNPVWSSGEHTIQLDTPFAVSAGETWTIGFVTSGTDGDGFADQVRIATDENSGLSGNWYTYRDSSTFRSRSYAGDLTLTDSPSTSATYLSETHSVTDPDEFRVNITQLADAEATVTWEGSDDGGTTWDSLAGSDVYTTTGVKTTSASAFGSSYDRFRVRVDVSTTGPAPQFQLASDSVWFTDHAPTGQLEAPADGVTLTQSTVDFTVNVTDTEFSTAQGDTVEATLQLQEPGSSSWTTGPTTTAAANGSVTVAETLSAGGNWSYRWELTDSYGVSSTTTSRTVTVPSQLTFRNEQDPDQILTGVQVNVTAYYGDEAVRRNTSDGTIDLGGFPVDQPIIIRASGENYATRTVVIESIYQQSSMYLLNESVPTYQVRFDLQDPTGEYDRSETVLFVERVLTLDNTTKWRVISGDSFGVKGVPVTIEQNQRYRLRVKNLETGTTATIGAYTAIQSETVTVSPGSASIDVVDSTKAYGWETTENETGQYIVFQYLDTQNQTSSLTLTIHERFNNSNVIVDNATFSNTNNLVYQTPLTANQTNKTWMAEIYLDRGGEVLHFREPVSGPRASLIPVNLDPTWASAIGVFVLLITAMAFSELNRSSGAVATALVGGMLWQIGFLSTVAIGPAVVLAIGVALVAHYRGDGGGY